MRTETLRVRVDIETMDEIETIVDSEEWESVSSWIRHIVKKEIEDRKFRQLVKSIEESSESKRLAKELRIGRGEEK